MKFSPLVLGLATALLLSADALSQSRNVTLLGRFQPAGVQFNDIWGYRHPANGKEYALVGSTVGTYVVDCTNPRQPVNRGLISGLSSTWRDIKVFGSYAYIVTEARGGGMQIVDLRNPDQPRLVATYGTTLWSHAHNIAMDLEQGIAIVHGTGGRSGETVRFLDVKTNPTQPQLIASWNAPYQHDLAMQNGLLHGSEIYSGHYALYDVSNLNNIRLLGRVTTPAAFTHNTWPTYDDRYCVTTDERANGPMGIYDISARGNPVYQSQYHAGPSTAIIHNAYVKDYVAHMSHYTEGYRSVDISDPKNPVEVGFYDTWPGASIGYNGAWGCYHLQPSGTIYINDIQTGLYVVKPLSTAVRYGDGTPGTGGRTPVAHTIGAAWLGNRNFKLGVREARAQSAAILILSGRRANLNFGGLRINVDLIGPTPLLLTVPTNQNGAALLPFPIPSDTRLNGLTLNTQYFVVDAAGVLGVSATQGLEFQVFSR